MNYADKLRETTKGLTEQQRAQIIHDHILIISSDICELFRNRCGFAASEGKSSYQLKIKPSYTRINFFNKTENLSSLHWHDTYRMTLWKLETLYKARSLNYYQSITQFILDYKLEIQTTVENELKKDGYSYLCVSMHHDIIIFAKW